MTGTDTYIRDPEGGANQSVVRDQNARLVLSFIRRHGAMSGAELARRSGLSPQTVSNIFRVLETEALVSRGPSVRGKVGKPSTPMELNPRGVFSLGLSIGRRTAELALVDFTGNVLDKRAVAYAYPEIETVFGFLRDGLAAILDAVPDARSAMAGIGVSRPSEIWAWLEQVDAPEASMRRWQDIDLAHEIADATGLDVFIENDATSACLAEHMLGRGGAFSDYAYVFVGAFVGGGLVLNGKIVWGRTGNTAALGIMPVCDDEGRHRQLLDVASLHVLEARLAARGIDPRGLRRTPDDWSAYEDDVAPWLAVTARHLAFAAASIASVIEVEAVLIDGAMPLEVRNRLTRETARRFADIDLSGIGRPTIEAGSRGRNARAIGAALLPIHARYFLA